MTTTAQHILQTTLIAALLLTGISGISAQGDCGAVDRILPPIDTGVFVNVQDYAVRSVRHDGRYHTGEDWTLVEASALGAPVRAIANGRVTYAYEDGWGRDGGVVILEHVMPNDVTYYSIYGHLMATETAPFPAGSACVSAGDVIGAIGNATPSPHLHFEVRTGQGSGRAPGLGYTWGRPNDLGYRRPSRFLVNWRARLNSSVDWVTDMSIERGYSSPPLVLDDNSLIVINNTRIERVLPDGRQLWRTNLDRSAVVALGFQGQSYVHFADGTVQQLALDGEFGEFWQTFAPVSGAPFALDDALVFGAPGGGLVALDATRRNVAWEAPSVPAYERVYIAAQVIGLHTADHEFVVLARNTRVELSRVQLRPGADAVVTDEGNLLVYSRGGLWRILADGVWEPVSYDVPLPAAYGAIATGEAGELLLYDGETVYAYNRDGVQQWTVDAPPLGGRVQMDYLDGRALLYSTGGDIVSVSSLGAVCAVTVYGAQPDAYLWRNLGSDGTLRLQIGGTLVGVDWQTFSRNCPE